VFVPKEGVETRVIAGLQRLMDRCTDPKGATRRVNEKLRRLWEETTGCDPLAAKRVEEVERKIGNIWQAIEDGLADTATANARLAALQAGKEELEAAAAVVGEPPQIDVEAAMAYRRDAEKVLSTGSPAEQKRILRTWVSEVKLAPERLEVKWTYRLPEPVVSSLVAGACFSPIHNVLATALAGGWVLPRMGRRLRVA
jgi:hypothetical protein